MRIAVAGKGGAGKTTISATLCRLLARRGHPVVAIDADSNPNLASALGLDRADVSRTGALPPELVSRRFDGPALTRPVREVIAQHCAEGPDGVRLAVMGAPAHAEEGCLCSAHATVSALLADLTLLHDAVTVVDMEASPEHLSRGTARHVDVLLLVTEPYYRSLETIKLLARLAQELPIPRLVVVANKVARPDDLPAIAEFCARHRLELAGSVPYSEEVAKADADGVPAIERAPDGDAVGAIGTLADTLLR